MHKAPLRQTVEPGYAATEPFPLGHWAPHYHSAEDNLTRLRFLRAALELPAGTSRDHTAIKREMEVILNFEVKGALLDV